MICQTLI